MILIQLSALFIQVDGLIKIVSSPVLIKEIYKKNQGHHLQPQFSLHDPINDFIKSIILNAKMFFYDQHAILSK